VGTLKERATDAVGGWHALVNDALAGECTPTETSEGPVLEWRRKPRREPPPRDEQTGLPLREVAPAWLERDAPPPPPTAIRLTPSAIRLEEEAPVFVGAGSYLAGRRDPAVVATLDRGRLVHRLLESLPDVAPEAREATGARYLAAIAPKWPDGDRAGLLAEVLRILADPAFAPVFAPGSRAEVDVAGSLAIGPGMAALSGRIDRLAVTAGRVLIVDYKTNRPAPTRLDEAPAAYVAQLSLYSEVLRRLYPNHSVAAAILWTDLPALMEIPSSTLDASLAKITASTGISGKPGI
jgi:ATP-dependent helicase/nuclease subunit A